MAKLIPGNVIAHDNNGAKNDEFPSELPMLPLRNVVIFPTTIFPIAVERESSLKLIDETLTGTRILGCLFQKSADNDTPGPTDMHRFGTVCRIIKMLQLPNGAKNVVLQGLRRFRIVSFTAEEPYMRAEVEYIEDTGEMDISTQALINNIRQNAVRMATVAPNVPDEVAMIIQNIEDDRVLLDMISANLNASVEEKVAILGKANTGERAGMINALLIRELEMLELSKKINDQVKGTIDKSQREYFLREQLKAIQKELGEVDEHSQEIEALRDRVLKSTMPEDIKKSTEEELNRLDRISPASPEYPMLRNHLDVMLDLPWGVYTKDNLDINAAQMILDEDHYDLKTVKERILEFLSVRKLNDRLKGPILCFIGPPGVGKTSLGQSIARAIGRKFVRISLGGVHDEAEIRGHRRTYIGALPGRIIQGMKKAGSQNPLFMLDEIDKVGSDFRGDPTAALLEVLDPAQNGTFEDHYLGVPFDLSRVLFICTGNEIGSIPPPLLDRMEVIRLPGYTEEEKVQIAQKYLVPNQIEENGLKKRQLRFAQTALRTIIADYTREAGVRNLDRQIANVCRKAAKKIATGEGESYSVTKDTVRDFLGPATYYRETVDRNRVPGVSVGLAWTPVGGTILFIETGRMKGTGKLMLTGNLGDTMKESAQAALSYIRSKESSFGITEDVLAKSDIHIHIPAGAIPKDGPSAGVALFSSLLSMAKDKPLPYNVAMTGEISLRGTVLPVGGIKEKLIGAKNAGIKTVLMPRKNEKDLVDVPDEIKERMEIRLVDRLDEVVSYFFPVK